MTLVCLDGVVGRAATVAHVVRTLSPRRRPFLTCLATLILSLSSAAFAAPVNVNTADAAELEKVNGVGSTLAARIVEYREANGPFTSLDDLTNVSGIGPGTLAKLKSGLTVSRAPSEVDAKIDLNLATTTQLQSVPGMNDVLAGKIVDYRNAHGPFRSLDDLDLVKGVNEAMIETWKSSLRIEDAGSQPVGKLKLYRPPR